MKPTHKRRVVCVDLNPCVDSSNHASKIVSVAFACAADHHTRGISEALRHSFHDIDAKFLFPSVLKRVGICYLCKVGFLVLRQENKQLDD